MINAFLSTQFPRAGLLAVLSVACAMINVNAVAQTPTPVPVAAPAPAPAPVTIAKPVTEMAITRTAKDADLKWNPCPPFLPKGCGIAVLNGDPAKNNLDVFFKIPGKSDLPRHWHTSAERMILVAGELHVTYDGQKTAILKPGSYAYGPARKPHSGKCASKEPCILFIAFELPLDAVEDKAK